MSITIVHTNDTHGNFRPPVTERLRALREAHPESIRQYRVAERRDRADRKQRRRAARLKGSR